MAAEHRRGPRHTYDLHDERGIVIEKEAIKKAT